MGKERVVRTVGCLSVFACWLLAGTIAAQAATFTVNTNVDIADANPGDGVCESAPPNHICTLRAAIQETNALAGTDEIILPPNTYLLTVVSELGITGSLTIIGGGASTTIIDGNKSVRPNSRVLVAGSGITVNISGVTIRNGGTGGRGGGIFNVGILTLTNSTVSGNNAGQNGGGIYMFGGTANSFNSTITDNRSDADLNGTGVGGGVHNAAEATFTFQNTILAGNSETQRVGNFFVATTGECDGTIISSGNNLMENYDTSHCTVIGNPLLADPKLSPLQNNGGPTQTHALLTGSPAIDGGNSTGCRDQLSALLLTDQRGAERHLDGDGNGSARCDIGAVEFGIVPGALDFSDFDGDGKADFAVYNSATAGWSIIRSSDGGLTYKAWGGPGWEPVPADYDGDGKADIAVYNASNGLWSIVRSSDGGNTLVGLGGGPQDIPLN